MSSKDCYDPRLRMLLEEVARDHGLEPAVLRGRYRACYAVAARRDFCRRAFALHVFSTPEIGGAINRDHTTVLHHCGLLNKNAPIENVADAGH